MKHGAGLAMVALVLAGLVGAKPAVAKPEPPVPATYVRRLEQLALLQTFNSELLSHDSATAVLQAWCGAHDRRDRKIVALQVKGQDKPLPQEARAALGVAEGQPVRYRRVRLSCGSRVLSEADNWYLPSALTLEMNQALETSQTPFGVVVQPLNFHRRGLSAHVLYAPLPPDWTAWGAAGMFPFGDPDQMPAHIIENSAVLTTASGVAFSYVVESYTRDVLAMALPLQAIWRAPLPD